MEMGGESWLGDDKKKGLIGGCGQEKEGWLG